MSRAPTETQRAILDALVAGFEPLRAVVPMPLSQWAEEQFQLSAESSHTQGQWHSYPFQKGWMDAFSNDDIEEVNVRKSKRVGYTKTLVAFAAYNIAHRKRKQAIWQPTDDDRDSFVKSEIDPMLRDVQAVQPFRLKGKEDTLKLKQFLGSVMHTLGGKAARAYRRITVAVAILDEASAFDLVVEKSINPVEGARGRLEGAPFPKLIVGSTPRIKGLDHVETREQNAEAVMRYQVICPHCGVEHPLTWGGKKIAHGFKGGGMGGDTGPVRHICPHCRGELSQAQYLRIYGDGVWISDCGNYRYGQDGRWRNGSAEPIHAPRHVAFVIWAAYSPQREWSDIVREFVEAKKKSDEGENGPLITFVNETLGELWEEVFEKADQHELASRAENYPLRTVPMGGLVLVAGVDVQDDRFEAVVWAIGRGEEMWAVDYQVISANPADEREWTKLDEYLAGTFRHASGQHLRIEAAAVDTGGHFTHQAYNFCRTRERRRIYAVKGDHQPTKMVKGRASIQDVNWRGQILKRGVKLWFVGTDTAKDLLYGRLQVTQPGPGYVHFSKDLPDQFYEQLTVESRMPVRTARGIDYKWVNAKRRRNEVWDCFDDQTEVLTARGWLPFADVTPEDHMATVNLETDAIEYQSPVALIAKPYSGNLLYVEGKRLNFAVTPNHRMVTYKKVFDRATRRWNFDVPPQITLAKDLTIHHTIKISARWDGVGSVGTVRIPQSISLQGRVLEEEKSVDAVAMARFLGWFVAEGNLRQNTLGTSIRRRVEISQTKPEGRAQIEAALSALPWKWHYAGSSYVITSKQLYEYVNSVCPGRQEIRRVPEWVKWSSLDAIAAFAAAAVAGDGWIDQGARAYATISKGLADDMAELFFKLGGTPSVTVRAAKPYSIRGRTGNNTKPQYHVHENNRRRSASLDGAGRKFMVQERAYDGMVYCATVPNGTLVVRRSGKMLVAGNCSVYAVFCTHMLNLHVRTEKEWERLAMVVQPPMGDLFEQPEQEKPAAAELVAAFAANTPPRAQPARPQTRVSTRDW